MKYLFAIAIQVTLAVSNALQQHPATGGVSPSSSRREFLNEGVAAGIAAGSASLWIPSSANAVASQNQALKLPPMGLGCWGKLHRSVTKANLPCEPSDELGLQPTGMSNSYRHLHT